MALAGEENDENYVLLIKSFSSNTFFVSLQER